MPTNWAGNITYAAPRLERPRSVAELQDLVAASPRIRALGSGHSFTSLPDTDGVLVSLADLAVGPVVDETARTVTVGAGARYGDLAAVLEAGGWALGNLASLPHISVVGAVSTGTHGSGVRNPSMAAAVAALEIVGPHGDLRQVARGDADFDGSVVALGTLGIVSRITLDIEPTYAVRQDVLEDLPFAALIDGFDELAGTAYSVSFFTRWTGDLVEQVWVKSRDLDVGPSIAGTRAASVTRHMLEGGDVRAVTEQGGLSGPWLDRLPHFRLAFTPSNGAELQSEYFVARRHAADAIAALRGVGPRLAPVLMTSEIRTMAGDQLWLSPSEGEDAVAFHFTWRPDTEGVYAVLPAIEEALQSLGARPHWGKCFTTPSARLATLYPRWRDFAALRARVDPDGTFGSAFVDGLLGG